MEPIKTLFEKLSLAPQKLTGALRQLYGGNLDFALREDRPYVIGNFVSTLDGVVSYKIPGKSGGGEISGFNEEDRFIMGLLRSCADAVLVGSGTLHGDPGHVRIPGFIYPKAQHIYKGFREELKKPTKPLNVIITGSGRVDLKEPTFHTPELATLIITTEGGKRKLQEEHGPALEITQVRAVSSGPAVPPSEILHLLFQEFGVKLLLHEGGPTLFGEFLKEGLVDELFLTVAPQVAGRSKDSSRPSFTEEAAFTPETSPWFELLSLKQADNHFFLRYRRR